MATYTVKQTVEGLLTPVALDSTSFGILLQKWQNLLYEGLGVDAADIEDETKYSYNGNLLISYLIIRDLVYNSVNTAALAQAGGNTATTVTGGIKKIETGPVNVERHDGGVSTAKLYEVMFNRSGLWEEILGQICALATRLGVWVSGCKDITPTPIKVIRGSDYSYEFQYPAIPSAVKKTE